MSYYDPKKQDEAGLLVVLCIALAAFMLLTHIKG